MRSTVGHDVVKERKRKMFIGRGGERELSSEKGGKKEGRVSYQSTEERGGNDFILRNPRR